MSSRRRPIRKFCFTRTSRWGEDCVGRLDGMFAFAVWDDTNRRLFCARDRLGIKPFYYATPHGNFVFASEIKALLAFPQCRREPDDRAVVGFLVHGNCDYAERTLFRGIQALPAAHSLTVDAATGGISIRRYWQLDAQSRREQTDEAHIAQVREALVGAVRTHLVSDVRAEAASAEDSTRRRSSASLARSGGTSQRRRRQLENASTRSRRVTNRRHSTNGNMPWKLRDRSARNRILCFRRPTTSGAISSGSRGIRTCRLARSASTRSGASCALPKKRGVKVLHRRAGRRRGVRRLREVSIRLLLSFLAS